MEYKILTETEKKQIDEIIPMVMSVGIIYLIFNYALRNENKPQKLHSLQKKKGTRKNGRCSNKKSQL